MKKSVMLLLVAALSAFSLSAGEGSMTLDQGKQMSADSNKPLLIEFFYPN